jgi:hypothetical protein
MKQVGKATPDRVRRFQKIGNDLCEFQEVEWLDKDGNVISRCCEKCGSEYPTEQDIRKEIAERYHLVSEQIENKSNEEWAIDEILRNTDKMYTSLMKLVSIENE